MTDIMNSFVKLCLPKYLYTLVKSRRVKDVNETITPIQLRHICRYEFAKSIIDGQTVLDAACGSGYGSDLLEPYSEYFGIDYADYCIEFAKTYYAADNRRFIENDLYKLDSIFLNDSFDSIISFETLEHIDEPEVVLEMFVNLLKKGGKLVISIPLNHPDIIYHKRQYTHSDVIDILSRTVIKKQIQYKEYIQQHLSILPLESMLPSNATGTWIGVLNKIV